MKKNKENQSNYIPGLTLSRREGEAVIINGTIRVLVKKISGAVVRLTFQNAEGFVIDREEVHLDKQGAKHA